jgi:hypothetical protein
MHCARLQFRAGDSGKPSSQKEPGKPGLCGLQRTRKQTGRPRAPSGNSTRPRIVGVPDRNDGQLCLHFPVAKSIATELRPAMPHLIET